MKKRMFIKVLLGTTLLGLPVFAQTFDGPTTGPKAAEGKTRVFVTHDERMVERCTRIIRLRDGVVESDEPGGKLLRRQAAGLAVA